MSAPYTVAYGYGDHSRKFDTLTEAIAFADARPGDASVRIWGDGAEGGYGDDGSKFWDGLTDDERELVEEAGL